MCRTVDQTSFEALLGVDGTLHVTSGDETFIINKGETIFIPANSGEYTIRGMGQVVVSRI